MKNKNKKTNITLMSLCAIVVILTLLIFSIRTDAGTVASWSEVVHTGDFTRFISYKPYEYLSLDPNKIFALEKSGTGFNISLVRESLANTTYNPTFYNSAMCLYHSQNNNSGAYSKGAEIENIVDIETPGTFTVYKRGSDPKVVNLTSTDQMECLTAFTYLVHQSTLYERDNKANAYDGYLMTTLNSDADINTNKRKYNANGTDCLQTIKCSIKQVLCRGFTSSSGTSMTLRQVFNSTVGTFMDEIYTGTISSYYLKDDMYGTPSNKTYLNNAANVAKNLAVSNPKLEKEDANSSVQYVGNYAYIGPLKVNYQGGTPSVSIEGINSDKIYGWTRIENNAFITPFSKISDLTKNDTRDFYIVVDATAISGLNQVKLKMSLQYETYKGRIVMTTSKMGNNQNLMFFAAIKDTKTISIDWTIEQSKKISIQKRDENGKNLAVEGIKFEVYNSSGTKVGELTTGSDGKTGTVNLIRSEEYIIKEKVNSKYGYKGCVITDATISPSSQTVSVSNGEVKVKITEDSTVYIKNIPELGTVELQKQDENENNLEGVKFVLYQAVSSTTGYLQLYNSNGSTLVSEISQEIDITDYTVKYVSKISDATKFVTDSNGKIIINNLEKYISKGNLYNYAFREVENKHYGFKKLGVTVKDGSGNEITVESDGDIPFNLATTSTSMTLTVKNAQELANLEIEKVGENNLKLEDVQFVIQRDGSEYLQLKDSSGTIVSSIKGTATINSENVANSSEYSVTYVSSKSDATIFITDANGKTAVKNVEINKNKTTEYSYTAYEIANPNYGYGSKTNVELSSTVTDLTINQTTQIPITNTIDLGNLELEKYDGDNKEIKLEDVGFAIEITPSPSSSHAYLALYDKNGKIVSSIKGTATINRQNVASSTEYEVRYYCTSKTALELSEEEKANITTFLTDSDGTLAVNNLEVYKPSSGNKYTYKLIEISNSNYGFIANGQSVQTTLESSSTVKKELANKQTLTKISGYVWVENPSGKSNNYTTLYEENTEENASNDMKLTDLYITDDAGNVVSLNEAPEKAKAPVKIELYDKKTGEFIKTQPDQFSKDGQYTFAGVSIEGLENYVVVFEYDGFYYTTTIPNVDQDNGSKVKEVEEERTDLNNLFGIVKDNNEIVTIDGEAKKDAAEYSKNGHESIVSKLNINTIISANTTETEYNLKTKYEAIKAATTESVDGIPNINMGIVLREQPKLALGSDIYSVSVDVNSKYYTYYYNGRQQHYINLNNDEVGVKFEQETSINRYTRPVYSSDVKAYDQGNVTMGVSIIYKVQITNQSGTLTSVVREIANYFDSDYTIEEIGLSISNNVIGNALSWSTDDIKENVDVENLDAGKSYNSIKISLSENGEDGVTLDAGQSKYVYIKYKVSESAIKGLLSGKSTYHNATEIMSYSTYYGALTGKQTVNGQEEYYVTEQEREGEIYAGIDRSSQPGNIELKLITDTRDEEGTKVLDTSNYEDDTTSAPALLLEPTTTRKISGTIFEDTATAESLANNEKLGDGIYSSNENTIDGVKVELYDASTGEIAKYSSGENAVATTDGKGNYTFGNDEVGVLPGDYIIKYTYNNESYIVDTNGNKVKNINVNDYKSTIITSDIVETAIENKANTIQFNGISYPINRWYIIQEANRYSDAIDNIDLRNTLDNDEVKNSTYQNSFESTYVMEATTPVMDVGIEFTAQNEAQVDTKNLESMRNRVVTLGNVDFGIIERPDTNFVIEKKITGLEITTQTGTNIVPKGDPSNPNASMQYVKTGLDGIVPAEIESKLLQGATLNLEYSITITNKCQIDYTDRTYYLYGTGRTTVRTSKVKKVVDYLDATMTLDSEQNSEEIWSEATAKQLLDNGLISDEVYDSINGGDYHILITEEFSELTTPESSETVKLYATKYLATSSTIQEENHVEIIELSGGRTIKESIPGNYDPTESSPDEPDDDKIKLEIISPTGTTVNYITYIIAAVVTFVILVSGIVIIKKKIIR